MKIAIGCELAADYLSLKFLACFMVESILVQYNSAMKRLAMMLGVVTL